MQQSTESIQLIRESFSPYRSIPNAWKEIYDKLPNASFFLSPEWTTTWIETYGTEFNGEYLIWHQDGAPLAIALLLKRPGTFGPFSVRLGIMNTSAEVGTDGVYLEYNDVLCAECARDAVREDLLKALHSCRWDQLIFSGYLADSLLAEIVDKLNPCRTISKVTVSPFVDLRKVRQAGLRVPLSDNTRAQIKRCAKLYERRGPLTITIARSSDEAHDFLNTLSILHQDTWKKRGRRGAFESKRFVKFHHTLINRAWKNDQIHLAKITAGDHCVGVLYGFYKYGKVYFYQSGFNYEQDNRLKPGLLCHTLMIEWYARQGAEEYDFLAGDSRYKRSLATDSRELVSSILDRDSVKMHLLRWLSDCRERLLEPNS